MKKLFYLLLISFAFVSFISSCSDDDTTEETLVGDWMNRFDMGGQARNNANTFVIDGKGYVICGYRATTPNYLRDVRQYDPTTAKWARVDSFPKSCPDDPNTPVLNDTVAIPSRIDAISFSDDTVGYYGLGFSESYVYLQDFYKYSPKTNKWTKLKDFDRGARRGATAFTVNGKGYVLCGETNDGLVNDMYSYDPATDSWTEETSIGTRRRNAFAFTIGSKVYVGSGYNNGYLNDLWEYDAIAKTWTIQTLMGNYSVESYDDNYNMPRANGVTFVINNKGYLTAGTNGSILNDVWEYDPNTDLWTRKSYFESTARNYASSFTINNRGYVLLGSNGSMYFNDMWEFAPDATAQ